MEAGTGDGGQNHPSDQPDTPAQQAMPVQPTRTRVGRKLTRMARMTTRNSDKIKILFENSRFMPIGPKKTNFDNWSNYLGFLGRKEPRILICSWKKVPDTTKELVCQGILDVAAEA
ncbi:hypothetical protein CASFOL_041538 [Castilleja foliolosa]|uniref:Uncharacterized protein n=1 Tax=Castilleja foliolosa TaxID=1961234 RepID=A0ABD3BB03_9LAMI